MEFYFRPAIILILLLFFVLSGCGITNRYIKPGYTQLRVEKPDDADIDSRLLLIGDAGQPASDIREPVLEALEIQASLLADKTTILFLGDNIYPYGLEDPDEELRLISESRLNEQIKVIENSKATGIFVPGNHDWDQGGELGWAKILNQEDYIYKMSNTRVTMFPKGGCPGPVVKDYGSNLRVIILDTQWWLHKHEKPTEANSDCEFVTEEAVLKALDDNLRTAGDRFVVIAAHHPLKTYGPHGGYFDWSEHLFPLTELNPYLWIPLPIIGSIYPIARNMGITPQDVSNSLYQNLINKINGVIANYDNLVYAAGHDHSLQVLKIDDNNYNIVSGFGTSIHHGNVTKGDDTIFADVHSGFMQVDVLKNGKSRLGIYQVDEETGNWIEVFSLMLNDK